MELLKIVSQIGQNYNFSFFLIFLKKEIPHISLGRIKHIANITIIPSVHKLFEAGPDLIQVRF